MFIFFLLILAGFPACLRDELIFLIYNPLHLTTILVIARDVDGGGILGFNLDCKVTNYFLIFSHFNHSFPLNYVKNAVLSVH